MPRQLTHAQATQNAAFLDQLRRTGNAREAARRLGAHRAKFTRRRNTDPAFAAAWDAALAIADAALAKHPAARPAARDKDAPPGPNQTPTATPSLGRATTTEPRIVRTATGQRQLRRAIVGQLTHAPRQRFLLALAATANIRLSAAAAGFSHSAFYQLRARDPGFAREMRLALQEGYERIEMALLAGFLPESHADDAWRHNQPAAIPPMTVDQALGLLALHQKEARLQAEPPHLKRRRGESTDAYSFRLATMYEQDRQRRREAFAIAEAGRRERGEPCESDYWTTPMPDLAQVTGWRKVDTQPAALKPDRPLAEVRKEEPPAQAPAIQPPADGAGQGLPAATWANEPPEDGWAFDDWQAYDTLGRG